jgi:hypothetical protein
MTSAARRLFRGSPHAGQEHLTKPDDAGLSTHRTRTAKAAWQTPDGHNPPSDTDSACSR